MRMFEKKFWSLLSSSLFLLGGLFLSVSATQAAINYQYEFQGKVSTQAGLSVADNTYDFSFRLYASPTGGAPIWTEDLSAANLFSATIASQTAAASTTVFDYLADTNENTLAIGQYLTNADQSLAALIVDFDTAANTVTVSGINLNWANGEAINNRPRVEGGVIDIKLGQVSSLAAVDFDQILYLETDFNGETMRPRRLLAASPYALEAASLSGRTGDQYAALSDNESVSGKWTFLNNLSLAANTAATALSVVQSGSGNIVEFRQGATTSFAVLADGRVRFNDYTFPLTRTGALAGQVLKLDAGGNFTWANDLVGSGGSLDYWATTTQGGYGDYLYQLDSGLKVVIGANLFSGPLFTQFEINGPAWFDTIGVSDSQEARFYDSDSSNYIGLKATGTINSDVTLTLPNSYGLSGQALLTSADGFLYWGTPTGAGTVGLGQAGQIPYYANAGTDLSATSSIFLGANGYVGIGTDTPGALFSVGRFGPGLRIDENGQVVAGFWAGDPVSLAYGGTGATSSASARTNLGLDEIYDYGVNTAATSGWVWIADGEGHRGHWVATSSLGLSGGQIGKFIGTSTALTNGVISTSTLIGYQAANYICASEYAGSHMCRTHEILQTIEQETINDWGDDATSAWIAEGPPGYTYNSNDCLGYATSSSLALGAFWLFNANGGGAGWLVNCGQNKPIACCTWQTN